MKGPGIHTDKLTKREQEVLDCLMDGLSYTETAEKLVLSIKTIKTHVISIFRKKDINSLQQLLVKEYKRLLARSDLVEAFKRIQKQIYQQMAEEILAVEAIRKAGEYFNFRCSLDGEAKVGNNWAETH